MINQSINHYLQRHEAFLQDVLLKTEIPANRLKEAMRYTLFPGGKRLRPLLVYLCGEIVNAKPSCLDIIAAAVELIHSYSLVHDDLPAMDNDDLRRGKPSCHKAFDEATAILAGDGLQALAFEILLEHLPKELSPAQAIQVTHELVKASGAAGMVSGQSLDLTELSGPTVGESQLRFIHSLKTGRLISACINMIIASNEVAESVSTALRSYAHHLGLVFQMQDDYLDRHTSNVLGKHHASDLANRKFTFANLYDQDELFNLITQQYQQAQNVLKPLEEKANNLLALTDFLQQRL